MKDLIFRIAMSALVLGFIYVVVGCAEAPPHTKPRIPQSSTLVDNDYLFEDVVLDGMTYRVWFKKSDTYQTGYCVFAVNLTKDKLEVEKLKRGN